jgi:hypothetical protein
MTAPYYVDESVTLHHGDCLDVMAELPDCSVDAVVTDPPYGLGFMGKQWDSLPPGREWAEQCLRVLKPGGYLLAFGGSRTWHRLVVAIEDGGFELRDSIAWLYGQGFPKSQDVSKAVDRAAGAERGPGVPRMRLGDAKPYPYNAADSAAAIFGERAARLLTEPVSAAAKEWAGWGTALKPAFEPIVCARKPLIGTVAANVLAHGTGALNIDACRVGEDTSRGDRYNGKAPGGSHSMQIAGARDEPWAVAPGRWPSNVVLDESQAAELDRQSGILTPHHPGTQCGKRDAAGRCQGHKNAGRSTSGETFHGPEVHGVPDSGGASRFFPTFRYEAKAPGSERPSVDGTAHPTVKPLDLMRWLVRLVTAPGGLVLDPFAGSGTTLEACLLEGFRSIGIEREADYLPLITQRLAKPLQAGFGFDEVSA